jgi:hypothetical protein
MTPHCRSCKFSAICLWLDLRPRDHLKQTTISYGALMTMWMQTHRGDAFSARCAVDARMPCLPEDAKCFEHR